MRTLKAMTRRSTFSRLEDLANTLYHELNGFIKSSRTTHYSRGEELASANNDVSRLHEIIAFWRSITPRRALSSAFYDK